jgi:uncharacterized protein (DUF58 family)
MDNPFHEALILGQEVGARYALVTPRAPARGLTGGKLGQRSGTSVEYMDHRDYQPGDDLRSIDWFAFARTDRLTVKLFHEEVSPHLDLIIDASRSMAIGAETGPSVKARATLALGAALAVAAESAGFTHTIWLAGASMQPLDGGSGPPQQWGGIALDYALPADAPVAPQHARWRRQGVRVLLSDLFWPGDPAAIMAPLADHAASLAVIQVLDQADANPPTRGNIRLADSETGLERDLFIDGPAEARYRANLARHQDLWSRACRQHGATMTTFIAQHLLADWDLRDLVACQLLNVAG